MLEKPKGTLVALGCNECRKDADILKGVLQEAGKLIPKVCVFTLAADKPEEAEREYKDLFRALGVDDISVINFKLHTEADSEENLQKVKHANVIVFGNGSQLKLSSLLGGTHLMARIRKRYFNERGFVVIGVSAGAAVMANTMIVACNSIDPMLKGELQITNGLNLIGDVFIDTHFTERGKFGCLTQTVAFNPAVLGLGLNDDTAIIIKNEEIEVVGSGLVVLVDGTSIKYNDVSEISHGDPITVEGIKMHFMGSGKHFLIKERQILPNVKEYFTGNIAC
jgi:cyanophycinase